MSRMKLRITGQSNQVLRHPIRSCYGMILQVCKGNKEFLIIDKALKLLLPSKKTVFSGFLSQFISGNGFNQRAGIVSFGISIYRFHFARLHNPALFHNQNTVAQVADYREIV